MTTTAFMQTCPIRCPSCKKEVDFLKTLDVGNVCYCACDDCVNMILRRTQSKEDTAFVHSLLRIGFRSGFDQARRQVESLFANGMKSL